MTAPNPLLLAQYGAAYSALGWCLCSIPPGTKGPSDGGWNSPAAVISGPDKVASAVAARPNHGFGLVHAPSGTCALDIDDYPKTKMVLWELFGVDLDALLHGAPQIVGRTGRGKGVFRLTPGCEDLATRKLVWPAFPGEKPVTLFELRAGRVQDVLPPTVHPDTGQPYRWKSGAPPASIDEVPVIPDILLSLWRNWDALKGQMEAACPWATPAPAPPPKRRIVASRDHQDLIGKFNQAHDVCSMLESAGYKRRGNRYLSPTSSSGLAGVCIMPDGRCYSHHASDPLNDGHAHDAFDLYVMFDHAGDQVSAMKTWAERVKFEALPDLPLVDVQLLIANAKRRREKLEGKSAPKPPDVSSIPGELTTIPGALGDLVDHIVRTAIRPQRVLAVTSALALGGTLMGRIYASVTDLRTNPYLVSIASTTSGKDHPRQCVKRFLYAAGLKALIGGEEIKSGAAVLSAVTRSPKILFQLDEFGLFLQAVTKPDAGSFEADILRQLMIMRTSASSIVMGPEYADQRQRPMQPIEYPHLVLSAVTTAETLWPALNSGHVLSGFLNRMILVSTEDPLPTRQKPPRDKSFPPELLAWAKTLITPDRPGGGNLQGFSPDAPFVIEETAAGERILEEFADACDNRIKQLLGTGIESLWGRAAAQAVEIAMIVAGSTNPDHPVIGEIEARWAVQFVEFWTNRTMAEVQGRMIDPDFANRCKAVLRVIRAAKGRGASIRELAKAWRGWRELKPREQDEILAAIGRNGDAVEMKRQGSKGPAAKVWVAREFASEDQVGDADE